MGTAELISDELGYRVEDFSRQNVERGHLVVSSSLKSADDAKGDGVQCSLNMSMQVSPVSPEFLCHCYLL